MTTCERFTGNVPCKRGPYRNTVEGIKWCPKCRDHLRADAFGFDLSRHDGLSGWCRKCRAKLSKAQRDRDIEQTRADMRKRYRKNPAKSLACVTVARAVAAGKLAKPKTCPVCNNARRIEAHHYLGYARKNWLDVVWRCRQCHTLEHKRRSTTANAA